MNAIAFGAPRPIHNRAALMHRVRVTENNDWRSVVPFHKCANAQVFAKIFKGYALN